MDSASSPSDRSTRNSPNPPPQGRRHGHASRTSSTDTGTAGGNAGAATAPIPDEDHGADKLPLTMSASVVLTGLPRDAHQALADAEAIDTGKGRSSNQCLFVFASFPFQYHLVFYCRYPALHFSWDLYLLFVLLPA